MLELQSAAENPIDFEKGKKVPKRVADLLVGVLLEAGVQRVYGVSGDSLNEITDSSVFHRSRVPVFAITTQFPSNEIDSGYFHLTSLSTEKDFEGCVSQIRFDHTRFDEMEKLTMPTNRTPKAIHSRTLSQSIFVNLVAQLLLSFSQPMLAQSQQKPVASAEQNSQALEAYEAPEMTDVLR